MSLDMTVGRRRAAALKDHDIDVMAAKEPQAWVQHLTIGAAAAFGAVLSSVLGVLMFLR